MNDLSSHFSIDEFTHSDTAMRMCIDNTIPESLVEAARATAQLMERVRAHLCYLRKRNTPVTINSAYRCPSLNRAIGSADTSDHPRMMAVDFVCPAYGTPFQIAAALVPVLDLLGIGQLIFEHTWVHVSSRYPDKVINRILTVQGKDYIAGIVEV